MITSVDEAVRRIYLRISTNEKIAFMSALVCGFMAHGYMFANKLSFHDDMSAMFGLGRGLEQGRWFLEVLTVVGDFFSIHASSSWYNGMLSLLFLALSATMIVKSVEIKSVVNAALCGGIISVFPTVAATFAYMFTAPAYCLAVLIICIAVYVAKKENLFNSIISGVLISVSLGIYQAYIGVFSALAVIILMKESLERKRKFYYVVKRTIAYLNSGAVGIGLYLLTNKILYVILNKKSIYSQSDLKNLPTAVIVAYERFFDFFKTSLYGINPYKGIRYMMILLLLITIVVFCREIFSKEIEVKNKIMASIFFVLFPVAVNFVYIITLNNVMVHSLMLYPMCSIFILFCAISEIGDTSRNSRIWTYVSSIGIFCLIGSFIKVDNVAYQYCSFVQEQTMTYYTNLINRIQSCDGYDASLPVAFLNIEDAEDESMMLQRKFDVSLTALEFDMRQVVSDYAYKQYLGLHCGYDPSYVDSETIKVLKEKTEVRKMSSYPEEDSIKVIDGIVVVKFAEIQ